MNIALVVLLLAFAGLGHLVFWVSVYNRWQGLGIPRWFRKLVDRIIMLVVLAIPAVALWQWLVQVGGYSGVHWLLWAYGIFSIGFCGYAGVFLYQRLRHQFPPPQLLANHTDVIQLQAGPENELALTWSAKMFASFPGNEIYELHVQRKTFSLPNLPDDLDGLFIAHLTDLHITGDFDVHFYETIVDQIIAAEPDLICITGDIIEEPGCMAWLGDVLGRLSAPHGVYFVLGNHDKRMPSVASVRDLLTGIGMVDLGSSTKEISIDGYPVLLAGNERPWLGTLPPVKPEDAADPPPWRLLLSHTPDNFPYARQMRFDLMLAGHTHGGQIRLPMIGPIVAPSIYGTKYACGTFYESPTLLHVSRGVSGYTPIRLNCPPEVSLLVLRQDTAETD
jgi:predicted MPP superfamily phosphohydrolase